jgi:Ni,Fe-hydrogenase III component G
MENLIQIDKSAIVGEGKKLMEAGAKFVTAVCNDLDKELEVTYFFSSNRGTEMKGLRCTVGKDEEVQSLSGVTLAAVLIENELQELFGLQVKGIAIDYGGHMLLAHDSPTTPMLKEKKAEPKAGAESASPPEAKPKGDEN